MSPILLNKDLQTGAYYAPNIRFFTKRRTKCFLQIPKAFSRILRVIAKRWQQGPQGVYNSIYTPSWINFSFSFKLAQANENKDSATRIRRRLEGTLASKYHTNADFRDMAPIMGKIDSVKKLNRAPIIYCFKIGNNQRFASVRTSESNLSGKMLKNVSGPIARSADPTHSCSLINKKTRYQMIIEHLSYAEHKEAKMIEVCTNKIHQLPLP